MASKHTVRQSSPESLELAKLSNDLEDMISRSSQRESGTRLGSRDSTVLKRIGWFEPKHFTNRANQKKPVIDFHYFDYISVIT